ncbi:MAG: alkaline phosphatase D family protein [Cytophagales bacterium]
MKNAIIVAFVLINTTLALAQSIQSGPMLGYSEMREVLIWLQTDKPANVKAAYWVNSIPGTKYFTDEIRTSKDQAFTAKLIADKVQPSNTYSYEVYVNNKLQKFAYPLTFQSKKLWLWRTDAPDFTMALGSCTYVAEPVYDRPGDSYGGNYEIFTSIYNKKPDLMLWLGDNTYLREADWDTKTGIYHRYTHSRSLKQMQPLLANAHNYAIWDDHDYGPNDSDRSFWNKNTTFEAFKLFWGNPSFGVGDTKGTFTSFQWADCEFFMLDNRFFRSPNNQKTGECTVLGKEQLQWFKDALIGSKASFKFVAIGGQFLNELKVQETYANLCSAERDTILAMLKNEKIPGVIFFSGDRHHSEVSKLVRTDAYPLHDFTISSLTSRANTRAKDEKNSLRIPESLLTERNFGMIEVTGSKNERQLKLIFCDVNGVEKWSTIIKAKDLK